MLNWKEVDKSEPGAVVYKAYREKSFIGYIAVNPFLGKKYEWRLTVAIKHGESTSIKAAQRSLKAAWEKWLEESKLTEKFQKDFF